MAPKKVKPTSKSTTLTRTGPKEVIAHPTRSRRREYTEKPTTARALVLRNGKQEVMGTGEFSMLNKITGKEKLDLLAEELIAKMTQAILTPFRLEQCLRIAESKYTEFVDDIADLKDPQLFRYVIEDEITARTPTGAEPRRNATSVARVVGTRIHNTYMVASAWKLISETLNGLANDGVTDTNIKLKLKNDVELRQRFLVLYDMVKTLVKVFHSRVSVLATTCPHYAKFFKSRPTEYSQPGQQELVFDLDDKKVRAITSSFLDSIIIELLFPDSKIPEAVLYQLLQDVIQESPHQAKRFTGALWNAIGDLSFSVQLQTILEGAIIGPEEKAWKNEPRTMPEEFEKWVDAQFFSDKASSEFKNWKDSIYPIVTTKKQEVLDKMWKMINFNYQVVSGQDIDTLWQLNGAFDVTPQWSSYYIPALAKDSDDEDAPEGPLRLAAGRSRVRKPLALMATESGDESAGSMPGLQSISNSSEEEHSSDDDSDDDDGDYESEASEYDEDEEDNLRDLLREAMDAAHEVDWFENANGPATPGIDPLNLGDKKGNPFLRLLGSLRGRFLNSDSKLKAQSQRTEPRGAFRATPSGVPKPPPSKAPPKVDAQGGAQQQAQGTKNQTVTMEEVEDEEAGGVGTPTKKKKKKNNKRKKKRPSAAGEGDASSVLEPSSPPPAPAIPLIPQTPASPKAKKAPVTPLSPKVSSATAAVASASASTLNIPIESTQAQSGRAYLKQQQLDAEPKSKVKSRPDQASIYSVEETKKTSFFSKLKRTFQVDPSQAHKNPKYTWFSRLSKKATDSMHQLLRTSEEKHPSPMKWDTFVKLMREMGFQYDPSTAGSSVRFDPPNPNDQPISIHRPHPDSTLTPIMLIQIGKRLKRRYGWNEDDFIKQTRDAATA